MNNIINWELLKNPYNWIVVWLMITIGVLGITYLYQNVKQPSL